MSAVLNYVYITIREIKAVFWGHNEYDFGSRKRSCLINFLENINIADLVSMHWKSFCFKLADKFDIVRRKKNSYGFVSWAFLTTHKMIKRSRAFLGLKWEYVQKNSLPCHEPSKA